MRVELSNITKSYQSGEDEILTVLKDVSVTFEAGQKVAIKGRSGIGKSTLLHLIAGLDTPTSGDILIGDLKISALSTADRAFFRRDNVGYVFQQFHLLPEFTAVENVAMPLLISGLKESEAEERAKEVLQLVGLEKRFSHVPSKLSGGECQRVSVARAFVTKPKMLLADEPTGNLDGESALKVRDLLFTLSSNMKSLLLVVTHSQEMAQEFEVVYQMESLGNLSKLK